MAEFQEVMKQAKRMCVTVNDCDQCELMTDAGCRFEIFADDAKYSHEIERIVMDWAAAHPEPRYPRWVDVLYEMGVFGNEVHNGNVHTCCLTDKAYAPIPADVADKLGIKPIGGDA